MTAPTDTPATSAQARAVAVFGLLLDGLRQLQADEQKTSRPVASNGAAKRPREGNSHDVRLQPKR